MTGQRHDYSAWPCLCILACLFVLCLAAPRCWERVARNQSAADLLKQVLESARSTREVSLINPPAADNKVAELAAVPAPVRLQTSGDDTGQIDLPMFLELAAPAEKLAGSPVPAETPVGQQPGPSLPNSTQAPQQPVLPPKTDKSGQEDLAGQQEVQGELPILVASAPSATDSLPQQPGRLMEPAIPSEKDLRADSAGVSPPAEADLPEPGDQRWREPEALRVRLEELSYECETGQWAMEADRLIRKLGLALSKGSDDALPIFGRLEELAAQVEPLAATIEDGALAGQLRRTGYTLTRRLDVWKQAVEIAGPRLTAADPPQVDPRELALCLAQIDAINDGSPAGRAWCEYLLVDALRELSVPHKPLDEGSSRKLAQRVLLRLTRAAMSDEQREVVTRRPVAALKEQLRRWAAEPVDLAELLQRVEKFEQSGSPGEARLVAEVCRRLGFSPVEKERQLGQRLETYYRNANLRITIGQPLLNRLIPAPAEEYGPVRDTILGVPVRGESLTSNNIAVRFLPDPHRLRLALEVKGEVAALTSSTSGPATFFNVSEASYVAQKPLEVDMQGIRLSSAEVNASNVTRLRSLRTNFDAIPLLGLVVQNVAQSQHQQHQPLANREAEEKISARARQRIDSEAHAKLGSVVQRLRQRVFVPLNSLSLKPTLVSASTSEDRMTMRVLLAGEDQLGSHTPRPRAPSDSLASLQIHETAINNLLQQLKLDGRAFALPDLYRELATKLNRPEPWQCDPDHEDVTITFAQQDPVQVRCQDGRMLITLAVARLSKASRVWKDFQVRVFYRPQVSGRSAELARDGVIQLIGPRLNTGAQIALRGIFAKTFPKDRLWKLTPEPFVRNPQLADLAITQFVVEEGWIGVALGPDRTVLHPAVMQR